MTKEERNQHLLSDSLFNFKFSFRNYIKKITSPWP